MHHSCPTPEPAADDATLEVAVYGLRRRESLRRLVKALAAVPCYPIVIFRIDRFGKLLGVVDGANSNGRIYYVQVRHWGREPDRLPDIGWTADPRKLGAGLRARAERKLLDYVSGARCVSVTLRYSVKSHRELCARMTVSAS